MVRIYTSSKMGGLDYSDQMYWRLDLEQKVAKEYESLTGEKCPAEFIHPPLFYNYEERLHKSEREIFEWELSTVCKCDCIVVLLDDVNTSVGALMEIGTAIGAKMSGKDIKIITIGNEEDAHPWLRECKFRNEKTIDDAATFIAKYILI